MARKTLQLALLTAVLAGCGGETFEYHSGNEIPEGPGMFSGEEGAFVLYSSEKKKAEKASARGDTAGAADPATGSPDEYREFREYQEFRRLKDSEDNTSEYREFQEWREWKAYKKWEEGQQK